MNTTSKHLTFIGALAALAAAFVAGCGQEAVEPGAHQDALSTSLVVYGYPGNIEDVFRKFIVPAFEAKYNIKVTYSGQGSSDTLARR